MRSIVAWNANPNSNVFLNSSHCERIIVWFVPYFIERFFLFYFIESIAGVLRNYSLEDNILYPLKSAKRFIKIKVRACKCASIPCNIVKYEWDGMSHTFWTTRVRHHSLFHIFFIHCRFAFFMTINKELKKLASQRLAKKKRVVTSPETS